MLPSLARLWSTSRKFQIGLMMLFVLLVFALLHPFFASMIGGGKNPLDIGFADPWEVPNGEHWFGTDRYGRDLFVMTSKGLTVSLQVGLVAGLVSTVIGVIIAFVAGYKGGRADAILNTTTDMFLVVPSFPLLLTLSAYIKHLTLFDVSLMLAAFSWPFAARTLRSQVLSLRSRPYVELAKVTTLSDMEIIFQELVPNLLPYIGVGLTNAALAAIFALVGLEVIGLGPSNVIDLGMMINFAIGWGALSLGAWPIFVAPVVVLSLLFISFNLINIGLEEVYNPRLRGTAGA